jgi:histone H3/H4
VGSRWKLTTRAATLFSLAPTKQTARRSTEGKALRKDIAAKAARKTVAGKTTAAAASKKIPRPERLRCAESGGYKRRQNYAYQNSQWRGWSILLTPLIASTRLIVTRVREVTQGFQAGMRFQGVALLALEAAEAYLLGFIRHTQKMACHAGRVAIALVVLGLPSWIRRQAIQHRYLCGAFHCAAANLPIETAWRRRLLADQGPTIPLLAQRQLDTTPLP